MMISLARQAAADVARWAAEDGMRFDEYSEPRLDDAAILLYGASMNLGHSGDVDDLRAGYVKKVEALSSLRRT